MASRFSANPALAPLAALPHPQTGTARARGRGQELAPDVPAWCWAFAGIAKGSVAVEDGRGVSVRRGAHGAVFSVTIPNATSLGATALQERTAEAYEALACCLESDAPGLHPVRFWNFIPDIHDPMQSGQGLGPGAPASINRYMVFNAGRFRAIEAWRSRELARGAPLGGGIAAATGVGYHGTCLVIHALAITTPGRAVENPRQVPAYRYSKKFGPLPPCFARGTVAERPQGPLLLVGGTASVRGEESVHGAARGRADPGDLEAQVRETMCNIACLIETGLGPAAGSPLLALRDVRVYHSSPDDRIRIADLIGPSLSGATKVEFVRADICRPELLVEIEGIASVATGGVA